MRNQNKHVITIAIISPSLKYETIEIFSTADLHENKQIRLLCHGSCWKIKILNDDDLLASKVIRFHPFNFETRPIWCGTSLRSSQLIRSALLIKIYFQFSESNSELKYKLRASTFCSSPVASTTPIFRFVDSKALRDFFSPWEWGCSTIIKIFRNIFKNRNWQIILNLPEKQSFGIIRKHSLDGNCVNAKK